MKGKWISKLLENKKLLRTGCGLMAAAVVFGGGLFIYQSQQTLPELPVFVDGEQTVILDEEVPLASAPKVTKKTTTKKTVKNVKMKVAATKTQTKKLPTKTKTKTTTKNSSTQTVKTVVKTTTTTTEKYTKKSKVKKVTTVVKTVTTTTTTLKEMKTKAATNTKSATPVAAAAQAEEPVVKKTLDVNVAAVMAHANVRSAYSQLGFTIEVDSTVNYSGKFDAQARKITLKKECDDIYHELGHFLSWMGGINLNPGGDGYNVYTQEKDLYTGSNKAYVTQNADEYLAEAYRDYLQNPSKLQAERPQTYASIEKALSNVTDARVALFKRIYGSLWK